jgi:hypothetical protein
MERSGIRVWIIRTAKPRISLALNPGYRKPDF